MSEGINVQFRPDLHAKLDELAAQTHQQPGELVEGAIAGYFDELADLRTMLDRRSDDLETGRIQPVEAADAMRVLKEKRKAHRAERHA